MVGCQPYAPAVFTPSKYSWYSFNRGWVDPRAMCNADASISKELLWQRCVTKLLGSVLITVSCVQVADGRQLRVYWITVVGCLQAMISGSLSSSGCGWRNGLQYGGSPRTYWKNRRGQPIRDGPSAWGWGWALLRNVLTSGLGWSFATT